MTGEDHVARYAAAVRGERTEPAPRPPEIDRRAVEAWFRRRGLPLVVRRDMRGSALLQRATPALTFLLVNDPLAALIAKLLDVPPAELERLLSNTAYVFALFAVTIATLVAPFVAGWLVAKWMRTMNRDGRLVLATIVLVLTVVVLPVVEWVTGLRSPLWLGLTINVGGTLLILFVVYVGAGSIAAWSLRSALSQLGAVGTLATRALPLLVLVVLFAFFATEMWQVAEALPRWRLWLVVGVLAVLAVLFMAAMLGEELRAMADRASAGRVPDLAAQLRGTPLEGLAAGAETADGQVRPQPLSRAERINVRVVLFVAQALQIVVLTLLVFCLFVGLGALAVDKSVVDTWLGEGKFLESGTFFNLELPVSKALVQVSIFLAVVSGLYFTASAATDPHYRKAFFDPLIDDVRVSLAVRQVYLAHKADGP
ncbi:MAG: hypothetical protein GEV28_17390 [Actinophytocola sp.]|uniref:hypothetical protein n=1 Tax=Actinophytocola sp. TaxID=1872138 RepID=UPI0013206CBD|nr:hypothetical protein [Actinophytocola sp.]MPZ82065.1 hypothetical protein [Actinophytocola sp.]